MNRHKIQQARQYNQKIQEDANEYQKLLHRVFVESEDGQKLLDHWSHIALFTEAHMTGIDAYNLGRTEGRKEFVREIINQSKQAEER